MDKMKPKERDAQMKNWFSGMKSGGDSKMSGTVKRIAAMKAKKKNDSKDPDAQPGFKPRPFMEKIKNKKKNKPTTLEMKPGMRKKSDQKFKPGGNK
jgi:hypothetical protein